ncbi:MAG: hypothetical protein ACRCSG_08690 [Cellulosilyticaceae bacterium]
MLEELKREFKLGKKVYLFQIISMILYMVFLFGSGSVDDVRFVPVINIVLIGWLLVNMVVVAIYTIYAFVKLVLKESALSGSLPRSILYKVIIFILFFSANGFIFFQIISMAVPIVALGVAFGIILLAKDTLQSRNGLIAIGVMWFLAIGALLLFGYPVILVILGQIISSFTIVQVIINVLLLSLSILIYYGIIRKCFEIYSEENYISN